MFCKKPLGSNEVVEPFPVGRRLALDPAKGRPSGWSAAAVSAGTSRPSKSAGRPSRPAKGSSARRGSAPPPRTSAWPGTPKASNWSASASPSVPSSPPGATATSSAVGAGAGSRPGRRGGVANIGTSVTINLATGGLIAGAGAGLLSGGAAGLTLVTVQRLLNRQAHAAEFRRSDGTRYKLAREHAAQFARIRADDDEPGFRVEIHKGPLSRKGPHSFEGDDARRAINALLPLVNGAGAAAHHIREACPGSNPTATRIGSSPIPASEGPPPLREHSLRPGAGGRSGCPGPAGSAGCPIPRASRWRWRCTKSRNGARSKANWRSWSERGAKPRRSPRSPTTSARAPARTCSPPRR